MRVIQDADDKSSRGGESRGKSQEPESSGKSQEPELRGKSQERESRGKSQDSLEVANEKEENGREAATAESAVSIHEPSSVTEEEVSSFSGDGEIVSHCYRR